MSLPDLSRIPAGQFKEVKLNLDKFKGGVNTLLSATRLKKDEAVEATNLILSEDGVWTKRWGTAYYGGDAGGSVVDGFVEYRKSSGSRELLIFANGLARKKDGDSWSTISGYTPTAGTPVYALQLGDYLYACNGTDSLARYDGSSFTTFTELAAPSNLLGTRANLTDGDYTYYCQVTTHNAVGESTGCTEATCKVNKERDLWTGDDKITWSWDKITGATSYSVYLSDVTANEAKIVEVGQMDSPQFQDYGTNSINDLIVPPDINTTGGPRFKYMCASGNRLWGCGNPDAPWTVYYSGMGTRLGKFDFAYGGGTIDLELGGKAVTKGIVDYQGKPHVFCPTPEGRGAIWSVSLSLSTVFGLALAFWFPSPSKITNQISSLAPRSIIQAENDIFFLTKRGVFILGNEPNVMSDVLRTNELSAKIRPYIRNMTNDDIEKTCAYYYDAKVFFATPSKIFVYDREKLCWMKDWTIGARQLGEYTDSSDNTHFLGAMADDGYLIKFDEDYKSDLGVAFVTSYRSPRFSISNDWNNYAWLSKVYLKFGEPFGTINFELLGTEKDGTFKSQLSGQFSPGVTNASNAGFGWDQLGSIQLGDSEGTPTTYAAEDLIRYISINKRLGDVQFYIKTTTTSSKYTLLGIRTEGKVLPTASSLGWQIT